MRLLRPASSLGIVLVILAASMLLAQSATPMEARARSSAATLPAVPATALGLNTAVWDSHLQDPDTISKVRPLHPALLRFPGGSTADVYHWKTNSITPGQNGYADAQNTFDHFARHVVSPLHTHVMVTVNYGTDSSGKGGGSPQEAAAWVRYANVTHHYGVRYWEIGNEVYGNGYYGASWEADKHADHSPAAYAANALLFIKAMKAQDRSIKVGLVLAAPGVWPDGHGPEDWNPTVLRRACSAADFVSVHWYPEHPGQESDAGLLASVDAIPHAVNALWSTLGKYCGARGTRLPIMVTETNSVTDQPGKQTISVIDALFLIEDYLAWLQAGVANVSWWDLHNGASSGNVSSRLFGSAKYGDYGLLSAGDTKEPPPNTPFPSYIAMKLLAPVLQTAAQFIPLPPAPRTAHLYAVRQKNGHVTIVAVNASIHIKLALHFAVGAMRHGVARVFGRNQPKPTRWPSTVQNGAALLTVPPYSAAVFEFRP